MSVYRALVSAYPLRPFSKGKLYVQNGLDLINFQTGFLLPLRMAAKTMSLVWIGSRTVPRDPKEWRLIICDERATHCFEKFQLLFFANKVHVVYFSAHILQPLDLVIFYTLESSYSQQWLSYAKSLIHGPLTNHILLKPTKEYMREHFLGTIARKRGKWQGYFHSTLMEFINSSLVKKCADLQELFSIHITPPTSPIQSEAF